MTKLQERGATEQAEYHRLRKYLPGVPLGKEHALRVQRTFAKIAALVVTIPVRKIVELGIGPGYIGGNLADATDAEVVGYEISPEIAATCRARHPRVEVRERDLLSEPPEPCDLLVMTEILEHVPDPVGLAERWMTLAANAVISSPENGDIPNDDSAGDHQWSFSRQDFEDFARLGGHEPVETELIPAGAHTVRLVVSRKAPAGSKLQA